MKLFIAIVVAYLIWRVLTSMIRMLAVEPDAPDPDNVFPAEEHFRCGVCGSEVVMTVRSGTETTAPRHCREPMDPIWRP